ncbi:MULTISPECIES: MCE family protein [unclassified Nocardioides]|uniref:MCE family protein n=1 Tax=unclassified Nocardioides TaxID=2615069 RepID=UPI0006F24009|nr:MULTISPECIES: MlaD family protein [unclassified Nocardioides]KRA30887.1 virulence factor Mce [Nocardioides sp. Root614]KRA87507.1 virulence factor Mce [Nocardioides sp. Root682]
MITRRTRIQLVIFAIITLVGVSFVGARYAKLDRLVIDRDYTVTAHYPQSGGIFTGAEVTYRGVGIGRVGDLVLTEDGVDVKLDIDKKWDKIPRDTLALVGNKSAVGEQYVELQPKTDDGPYLVDGSEIDDVATPLATEKILGDLSATVGSIDRDALRTTIEELGTAFGGTGPDLQKIIDTGNSFIETASDNFDITTALIRDSNTVLRGQLASESSLRTFATQLSAFSTALAGADGSLRKVIDSGSLAATQLRTFLEQNGVELSELLANVVATNDVVVKHLPGLKQLLVVYPWAVLGGMVVVGKRSKAAGGSGFWDAHFGLILQAELPTPGGHALCRDGYLTDRRNPESERGDIPMEYDVRCNEPITKSNPRGPQNLPRVAPDMTGTSQVVAGYDETTGELTWGAPADSSATRGNVAPPSLGGDSWKWLYLQPMLDH